MCIKDHPEELSDIVEVMTVIPQDEVLDITQAISDSGAEVIACYPGTSSSRIRKKYGMKKGDKLLITDENNYIKMMPKTRLADLVGLVKLDMNVVKKQIEEMRKADRY